jgi:2-methylisocitrate lyase-like PEP mutase family enzyme
MLDKQRQKAETFLELHHGPELLVLPNAWDVASAGIFEQASFQAIGTTSSGIAASLGYLDGEQIPFPEMLAVVERIVKNTDLPVNADLEMGYGKTPADAAETVKRVIQAGVAGINLEDGTGNSQQPLFDIPLQLEKLRAAREAAETAGVHLVINARTDTHMIPFPDSESQFQETVRRATAYRLAGADCIFIPGWLDGAVIARLVAAIPAPINIFASPVTPNVPELHAMGVARLSIGAGGFRAALGCLRRIATEIAVTGEYQSMFHEILSKGEVDSLPKAGMEKATVAA